MISLALDTVFHAFAKEKGIVTSLTPKVVVVYLGHLNTGHSNALLCNLASPNGLQRKGREVVPPTEKSNENFRKAEGDQE